MTRTPGRLVVLTAACLALFPAGLRADTVWARTGAGGGNALPVEGTILKIEAGRLQMQTRAQGNVMERPLDQIVKVKADGEPALNDAEEAFEQGKWDAAAGAYDRALATTRKEWVKDRAVGRLLAAAERANQFPLQAAAYAQLAARDPAAAADRKPAVPPAAKPQLPAAIQAVEKVYAAKPADPLLRSFLGELYLANGEFDKVNRLVPPGGARDPGIVVMQAKVALQGRNPAGAIQTIEQNKALFTTPDAQLEALHTLAEARAALAGNDPAKVQDAAIAYMRVVAHFGGRASPLVVDAMYKTAVLLERAGQAAEAAALYKQVADDPRARGTPTAAEAQKKHDQLKGARQAAR